MPENEKTNTNTYGSDLRELFTDETLSPTTPVYIYCPFHPDTHRPSMRVYENGAFCFTCGAYMSRHKLVRHVAEVDPEAITGAKLKSSSRSRSRARPTMRSEELQVLATLAHENLTANARRYFSGRGLSEYTVLRYKLGHYGHGYTLPLFSSEELNAPVTTLRFRRDDELAGESSDTPKYWGVRGANDVAVYPYPIADDLPTVILTEGEFDALLLRQEGLCAFSLTNGARAWQKVKDWRSLLPTGVRVKLVYDSDSAGIEASAQMAEALRTAGYVVELTTLPTDHKDLTEWRQTDEEGFDTFIAQLSLWEEMTMEAALEARLGVGHTH